MITISNLNKFLVVSSDLIFTFLSKIRSLISFLFPASKEFFQKRILSEKILLKIKQRRDVYSKCIIFYCSSAGEYEQARPLASTLVERGIFVHILFFSESGINFASIRNESLSYSLAPIDTRKNWDTFFSYLRPNLCIVVRHEFWPCFLYKASSYCKVILINGSLKSTSFLSLFLKKNLVKYFDLIYVVSKAERDNFQKNLSLKESELKILGDSKYDRVIERVENKKQAETFSRKFSDSSKKLVIGSAWEADCLVILEAYSLYKKQESTPLQIIIVPHQPTEEFVAWLRSKCRDFNFSSEIYSNENTVQLNAEIIIVDVVGILFDIYSVGDLAFVGGGLHHEVHNVLEPSAFALPLAFGPRYQNSHEAREIASENLARVVSTSVECLDWIRNSLKKGKVDQALYKFVKSKSGATKALIKDVMLSLRD